MHLNTFSNIINKDLFKRKLFVLYQFAPPLSARILWKKVEE